ncbi:CRP-like cAMP-activated global transcriptional regulator [Roseobacter fucihabitans]|uniref:CRP-like cAMP-activated global transcriptional regulator n=1 Tax=Roseobacter fucihabitans TaxID=1537242 RepID=A0ABZ2BNB2_9RHOB|nr:Crp/Fnr family transcriptional regulator [Roseobacter litoralis]MBC6964733.1 cAMP receptor protein [Roseobacter litoralis]
MDTVTLPKTGFLAHASKELSDLMASVATEVKLTSGETLFEQGEDGDTLYAIITGSLEFSVLSREGRKLSLDVMRPGALFGEIALFDPGTRTATVTALEPTRLRGVRNADMLRAIRAAPDVGIDMIQLAGERMRWMSSQLNEQVFLPMPARLARKILYLTIDGSKQLSTLTLSQAELAEFVGATREAVSKTLALWKRAGVIEATRGGVRVIDRDALQVMADLHQI